MATTWSVSAIGGNPQTIAHLGATLKTGSDLGLTSAFANYVEALTSELKGMTNQYPVGVEMQQKFAVAAVANEFNFSPNTAAGIPGKGGPESGRG